MGLKDSRNNRNLLKLKLKKVNEALLNDEFQIEEHFPNSKNVEKFVALGLSKAKSNSASKYLNEDLCEVPTFKEFVKTWVEENEIGWKESHRVNQVSILKTHILPKFGNVRINNIKREFLLNFRIELANQINTKNERHLSNARVNKIMSTIRQILNEAATRFDFQTPYQNIKALKNNPKDIHPFSLSEVLSLLETVRPDYRNYYTVRFFTGMRTGEIDGLKWKYVDFDKRLILVRETIVDGRQEKSAKTDSSLRDIQMSQQVYDALLKQHRATKNSEYVFCTLNGCPLAHRNVTRRVWKPLLSQLGLEYRKPYQSRHTAATLWLASGEAPEWIAKQLGHANTMMLFTVYSRFVPNLTRQDGSAFESLLSNHLTGLLHDFGKYSQEFQTYIKSATGEIDQDDELYVDASLLKGKIDHSTAGAQLIWQLLGRYGRNGAGQGELCGQILALCIASHHSGLIDCFGADDSPTFSKRMGKAEDKVHLAECRRQVEQEIVNLLDPLASQDLVKELFGKLRDIVDFNNLKIVDHFRLGFFTRFMFSCLIDADRLNSAEFEDPARKKERLNNAGPIEWTIAIERLELKLANMGIRNHVDELRREISENCKHNALKKQGIYTLTVPTGGGKTYASLRYALHHAQKHQLDRIVYVIPYTSIIEQNAAVIRETIETVEDDTAWVLEHHSNLEPEHQTWQSKLVSENWDAPIVLTSMVQLLETLFSGGTKSVRRLHQLANSVVIFDEIQTLPVNCVHLFCNALSFLCQHTRTTAVLCTATQPLLNKLKHPDNGQLTIPQENELAGDYEQHFRLLRRVNINNYLKAGGWTKPEITELSIEQFNRFGNCLVIVNTKHWAQELYTHCVAQVGKDGVFHLSTNQCPDHRKALLNEVKSRLSKPLPVLCISTQLIEAGVDVDFACVIRFLAGLDSIAQAAGRCNRNGALKDSDGTLIKGQVFVLNPEQESTGLIKNPRSKLRGITGITIVASVLH